MQCPNDSQPLAMTTREGIEIDYCPTCRGVWLDRGELDKIIERTAATMAAPVRDAGARRDAPVVPYDDDDDRRAPRGYGDHDDRGNYGDRGHYGKRKRRGFLDDLFDFD